MFFTRPRVNISFCLDDPRADTFTLGLPQNKGSMKWNGVSWQGTGIHGNEKFSENKSELLLSSLSCVCVKLYNLSHESIHNSFLHSYPIN